MSTIASSFTSFLRQIELNLISPAITQEKFNILIKMAEGFHALALKGYPGSLEMLNNIFSIMGERFHINFQNDDEELLELQGLYLQGFKNETFYNKKLRQFANIANNDAQFDEIRKQFEEKLNNKDFVSNLDTNGIGFLASVEAAMDTINQLDKVKKALIIGGAAIGATEKNEEKTKPSSFFTRIVMRIARRIVKKIIGDPVIQAKSYMDRTVNDIKENSRFFSSGLISKTPVVTNMANPKAEPSYLEMLQEYLFPSSNTVDTAPKDLLDLMHKARAQIEAETMSLFNKTLTNLILLKNKGLIRSKPWLAHIDKMEKLYKLYSDLDDSEANVTKKTEIFKDALQMLKQFSSIRIPETDTQLAALSKMVDLTVIKIVDVYRLATVLITAYNNFTKQPEYHDPLIFTDPKHKKETSRLENIRAQFESYLKSSAMKKVLDSNVAKTSINTEIQLMDQFGIKLDAELSTGPTTNVTKNYPLPSVDILSDIEQEMRILQEASETLNQKVAEIEEKEKLEAEQRQAQGYFVAGLSFLGNLVAYGAQELTGRIIDTKETLDGTLLDEQLEIALRTDKLKIMHEAISGKNELDTSEYKKINYLHALFSRLEDLENQQMEKPYTDMPEIELEIHFLKSKIMIQLQEINKSLAWKNIATKDQENFEKNLRFANAALVYLENYVDSEPKALQSESFKKLKQNLKDKVEFYNGAHQFIKDFDFKKTADIVFNKFISASGAPILERFSHEQENMTSVGKELQLAERKLDLLFIEEIIRLLNDPKNQHMLDVNKLAVFLGAINFLDSELHENKFRAGIGNTKKMLNKVRADTLAALQPLNVTESYNLYKLIDKSSHDALVVFVKQHEEEFKKFPVAEKLMGIEQKPTLYLPTKGKKSKIQQGTDKPITTRKILKNKPIDSGEVT